MNHEAQELVTRAILMAREQIKLVEAVDPMYGLVLTHDMQTAMDMKNPELILRTGQIINTAHYAAKN